MTESDWESLEGDILELLSDAGVSSVVEDAEKLTSKYIGAIRRLYRESEENDDTDD
jgi:hypothetical protein